MSFDTGRQRILLTLWISAVVLFAAAAAATVTAKQSDGSQDEKFSGAWIGAYTASSGFEGALKFSFRKEEKGEWQGKLTFSNQDGDHTLDMKLLQITAGKLKAKAENGEMEIAIEGELHGDWIEGTYSVKPTGTTEVVETGTWKVAKESAAKH